MNRANGDEGAPLGIDDGFFLQSEQAVVFEYVPMHDLLEVEPLPTIGDANQEPEKRLREPFPRCTNIPAISLGDLPRGGQGVWKDEDSKNE
jgi:hypothetical protein